MRILSLALCISALPSTVMALGFRVTDHGAEATARGGAFAATANNPTAVYHNPAGITQLEGTNFSLNVNSITFESTVDPSTPGADFDSKFEWQYIPETFSTWKPKDKPFALGLGFYSPFGFAMEYPEDSTVRTIAKKGKIQFFTANPVVAVEIIPQLSLAAGMTINYSRAKLSQGLGVTAGDDFSLKGEGYGAGVTGGLLWQPSKQHSFGVQYFGPVDIRYHGHARVRVPAFTLPVEVLPGLTIPVDIPRTETEEDADIIIEFPQTITAGYSFRPAEDWNFEFNVEWTDWDRLNTETIRLSESVDQPLVFNYESSFMYEFGVTKKLQGGWSLSAGYIYSENSVPNEAFNPIVPDSNRHVLSVGVGRQYDQWNWYVGYQYAYGPHRTIDQQTFADGNYRFQSHAVSFTLGCNF
jgi:long-chain fatty acid transport protein